jgi:hypothetical protein
MGDRRAGVGGRVAGSARELMLEHLARVRARIWAGRAMGTGYGAEDSGDPM